MAEIRKLSINELRANWAKAWGYQPHIRLGRVMMEASLFYKLCEHSNNRLTEDQQSHLNKLVTEYRRSPKCFDSRIGALKPGTRLMRVYRGKTYSVLVTSNGFEYEGQAYSSLSKVANEITGSKWNGWVFFNLHKKLGAKTNII